MELLFGGVRRWRYPPEFEQAQALFEVCVGVEVELVGEEGGGVDGMVAEGLEHVVGEQGFVVGWGWAAGGLGEGVVADVVAVVVVGGDVVDGSVVVLLGDLRYRDWFHESLLLWLFVLLNLLWLVVALSEVHALREQSRKLVVL